MRKLLTTLLVLSCSILSTYAQINGTAQLGVSSYQGDLNDRSDSNIGLFDELNPAGGIGVHFPLNPSFGFRWDMNFIRLSGNDNNFQNPAHANRGWSFTNNIFEMVGMFDWEILGKRRFRSTGAFRPTLTPVVFVGAGLAFTNSKVDWNNSGNLMIRMDRVYRKNAEAAFPIGLGLKYYFSEKFALSLETSLRVATFSKYYDGVNLAGFDGSEDSYGFTGLKAFFALGGKNDKDGDGITDNKDACPEIPGAKSLSGCPDADNDGIGDDTDKCPYRFGLAAMGGCPDADKDGVSDDIDECPMMVGTIATNGCPDEDGDGVIDKFDLCIGVPGQSPTGCADQDGDGVVDDKDECPTIAGEVFKKGCPYIDTDEDGVEDEKDKCPNVMGNISANGCPDFDRDGIPDDQDKCPTIAAEGKNGCPGGVVPKRPEPKIKLPRRLYPSGGKTPKGGNTSKTICDCLSNPNPVFNLASEEKPKTLTRLGTNPEFGNLHGLKPMGFYNVLRNAYDRNSRDRKFLNELFLAMGYSSFSDVTPDMFSEATIPYGTVGNIGYSSSHNTSYIKLNSKLSKDLMAFKIKAANGCDIHFMKTCGNHFFFCPN